MKLPRALLLALLAVPAAAIAAVELAPAANDGPVYEAPPPGMRRCERADGSIIFTDRGCAGQDATEVVPPKDTPPVVQRIISVRSCARSQEDLLAGVRDALQARDPNRLADYYEWTGMSTSEGYRLLDRLVAFSARPLLDVQLASSRALRSPGHEWPERRPAQFEWLHPLSEPDSGPSGYEEAPRPEPPPPPADLLRVDQLRSEKDLDSQVSYLHLRRNAGCWWLQF